MSDPNATQKQNNKHENSNEDMNTLAIRSRFFLPPGASVLMPGLLLTAVISAIALHTGAKITYVTPLIAAMGMGMILRNAFIIPPAYKDGVFFSMKQILRFAVALLGIRITFTKISSLGWEGIVIAIVPLVLTLLLTVAVGRALKVFSASSMLIGTGTAICGASAILTAGAIIRSRDENIIIAISSITVFGTISMLLYPLFYNSGLLPMSELQYGYWAGASIHEVAQVVTASFAGGEMSGETGILVKLTRVAALIPVALLLSYLVNRGVVSHGDSEEQGRVSFPYFLLGFLAMVVFNSLGFFTDKAVRWIEFFDMFLLTMAMAGMGLETDFRQFRTVGMRPLVLGVISTTFITVFSLVLVLWLIK
ncbi:MAG: YeiH family protein [Nitrospiraceae bacterium]|nr:YeiH family protein [Nitrospiraceae bacterium]